MDIINPELFEFDGDMSSKAIVNVWKERGAWFFDVSQQERIYYTLCNNDMIVDDNNSILKFEDVKSAFEYIQKNALEHTEVINQTSHYFVAKDDKGRFIMNANGGVWEFSNEEHALATAINYNDDLVKIRMAACIQYPRPVFVE